MRNALPWRAAQRGSAAVTILLACLATVAAGAGITGYFWQQTKIHDLNRQVNGLQTQVADQKRQLSQLSGLAATYTSRAGLHTKVFFPQAGAHPSSPLAVMGTVPGNWSFEAEFPVKLVDSHGAVIAQTPAHVLGDWMTDGPAPFSAQLIFTTPPTGPATLILQKANPSDLPQNADEVRIPLQF